MFLATRLKQCGLLPRPVFFHLLPLYVLLYPLLLDMRCVAEQVFGKQLIQFQFVSCPIIRISHMNYFYDNFK